MIADDNFNLRQGFMLVRYIWVNLLTLSIHNGYERGTIYEDLGSTVYQDNYLTASFIVYLTQYLTHSASDIRLSTT